MTMITLDEQIETETNLLNDARKTLQELRDDIEELRERIACQEDVNLAGNCPDIKRLTTLYNTCVETENRLGNCKERKAGIARNGVAYDLDAARTSIGGKLDNLRAAQCSGPVSECSE